MVLNDALDSDQLIAFLKRLVKDAKRKVFLILDNLRVRHAKLVKAWLARYQNEIEEFNLPSYSPELNPDEMLNAGYFIRVTGTSISCMTLVATEPIIMAATGLKPRVPMMIALQCVSCTCRAISLAGEPAHQCTW